MKKVWMFLAAAMLTVFFAGCGMSDANVESRMKDMIHKYLVQKKMADYDIKEIKLDKVDKQHYKGFVTISNDENARKWLIVVTVDGDSLSWKFDGGAKKAAKAAPAKGKAASAKSKKSKAKAKPAEDGEEGEEEAAPAKQQKEEEFNFDD